MTSPPKPSLSERMRRWVCYANDSDGQPTGYASEVDQQVDEWATEVAALEQQVATLERAKREQDERLAGLVKQWRTEATDWQGCEDCQNGERQLLSCADELHAATKGEE